MSSAIPPRLSVPILLQGAPSIFAMGHGVAAKFAALLGDTPHDAFIPTIPAIGILQLHLLSKNVTENLSRNVPDLLLSLIGLSLISIAL